MSLQLWLPLTKNALNYGVHPSNISVSNATQNTSGKIGGCYSFNGSSSHIYGTQTVITNNTDNWTFACWMKLNVVNTTQTLFSCRSEVSPNGITIFYSNGYWLIDDGVRWQPSNSLSTNTWYHVCIVRKKGVGKYLYINGVLVSSTTTVGTQTAVNSTNFAIGLCHQSASAYSGNPLNGYLNDVRFYDHALSIAEIKELAKGLVVHYKLDEFTSSDNLIVNGFGELGSENWNNGSKISTTEVPSGHSEIKSSMYDGNMTVQYIPIIQNHTYTISGYIKAMANQSGNKYPSIWPYDIDKKFMDYYKCATGFNNTYKTTLAQPLHKGDTVIYATNLSAWTTATNNHYFHVAIFGYKNSFGDVYPDMVYTQDSPAFGTYSDKSHIDKTNNTITLNAAFTGEDRPAGTTICQATEGSIYFYPFNGIPVTSLTDWVFKTADFKPNTSNRLKAAAYIRWNTYNGLYIAGNKLVDNNFNDTTITDSSGYGNHGVRNGNITISTSTPRYEYSTMFDGSSSYIDITSTVFPPVFNGAFTISMWVYNSDSGDRSILFGNYNLGGTSFNIEKTTAEKVRFYWNANPDVTFANSVLTANAFTHLVITRNGNTVKCYINGALKDTSTATLSTTITSATTNFRIGSDSRTGATMFKGRISDFRIYGSCLTDADVLRLYNTAASVSKNNSMLGYEMKEG